MKKLLGLLLAAFLVAQPLFLTCQALADTTITLSGRENAGSEYKIYGTLAFDSSYATGGEAVSLTTLGLNSVSNFIAEPKSGYTFSYDYSNNTLIAYRTGTITPAGTVAAPTFTGTAPLGDLNYASPAFSGTGQSSSGQVITTTDNQTMTLNQCSGMWFVSATHGPYLIASNTAVTGAPAVLTIYGAAPTTDAGTYKILNALTPVGTNSAPAFTGTATTAAALAEVGSTTNLSTLTGVRFTAYGK